MRVAEEQVTKEDQHLLEAEYPLRALAVQQYPVSYFSNFSFSSEYYAQTTLEEHLVGLSPEER